MNISSKNNRRQFLKSTMALSSALVLTPSLMAFPETDYADSEKYMLGPQKGFSPQVGQLLSTMTMMREWVMDTVKDLSVDELDFQIDDQSNSIGAMLLHLAATERYYQLNTFDNVEWGSWDQSIKDEWDLGMNLGEKGREEIKGHKVSYYLKKLKTVRAHTIEEFAKRDDKWIQESEPFFENKPTNNYCKWFHVCEHESNHRGQMKFVIKRLPK
ncbi:MAG: hypothetical protein BM564_09060 [Bacteroidetes bacterium MedPE-SWsnd-G2]|nr:MAG: hypothetical protein BM564_09060 [Bacteroidetes bacterium MedPE-SWsnd-G2]